LQSVTISDVFLTLQLFSEKSIYKHGWRL